MADRPAQPQTDPLDDTWRAFAATRCPDLRTQLIEHYVPQVRIVAAQLYAKRVDNSFEFQDLFQWGMIGLLESIDRFQPERGIAFTTYAEHRIRGEMHSGLAKVSEVASQAAERRLKARTASLAAEAATPFDQLWSLSVGLAIGFMLEDSRMYRATDEPATAIDGYHACELKQLGQLFRDKVALLPAGQQRVIRLHYFAGLPFADIAATLGVSKGRVSQLHKQGLAALHAMLAGGGADWRG